ncbi:glucans biosynthesis glucosyltransferase MdoH [Rubinisphaera italica]|uniref:Glucans biosynthesis glucosyltransferase H n=1 Tax=Rubinisphaera italica TaxID=2527969 RepID=A0A5C5XKL2_9PLAN|nr:glucans biosynthesis glucosyltransferase MdoH [Rubinisphaera italica]TWT62675.1 Glucans biosynthesis glucosyltransferase H [Rubinisphaera italica]
MESSARSSYQIRQTRLALLIVSLYSTILLMAPFVYAISRNGVSSLESVSTVLFAMLSFWVSLGFWNAFFGYQKMSRLKRSESASKRKSISLEVQEQTKTAILMPIYNEDPEAVIARLHAIIQSLRKVNAESGFEIFVLSDTTNPDIALREELVWSQYLERFKPSINIYYRRRLKNAQRKAGNIADFCERWGTSYDFMLVLDADSVMAGETIVEMVRRMAADPKLGILQVSPRPFNRHSLFARLQQFSAAAYGPLCVRGFCSWTGVDGNYWGHNALIRIRPFIDHCHLPILPGPRPLGGEILSHDFVEAALMRRAGWKVRVAADLEGSYEECPTTLADYVQRDQRWCQGNMQHARLVVSEGFHPLSRVHFAMGVMSYIASPLWLTFMLVTFLSQYLESFPTGATVSASYVMACMFGIFAVTMGLLLVPKFMGLSCLFRDRKQVTQFGGPLALTVSVFLEIFFSVLLAPVMAYYHSRFVLMTLMGRTVSWNSQQREETRVSAKDAWSMHWDVFAFYGLLGTLVASLAPQMLPWFAPILVGPLLVVPFAMILGSARFGRWLTKHQWLLIPEEQAESPLLKSMQEVLNDFEQHPVVKTGEDIFESVLRDINRTTMHLRIAEATNCLAPEDQEKDIELELLVNRSDLLNAPIEVRRRILTDAKTFNRLAASFQQA